MLLTPIGALAPGTAWGEWSTEELRANLGFVPEGLDKLGTAWTAAIPDYAPAFVRNPLLGYLVAAIVGAALVVGITWGIGRLLARDEHHSSPPKSTPPRA